MFFGLFEFSPLQQQGNANRQFIFPTNRRSDYSSGSPFSLATGHYRYRGASYDRNRGMPPLDQLDGTRRQTAGES